MDDPQPAFGIVGTPICDRTAFDSPRTAALWSWWADACRDGIVPWSAFDVAQHADLVPYIFVLQKIGDHFERRLYGEEARQTLGLHHQVRGQPVGAGCPEPPGRPAGFGTYLHAYYGRVLASGTGWLCSGYLPFTHRTHVRFEAVNLPLARGAKPDTVLSLIDRIG